MEQYYRTQIKDSTTNLQYSWYQRISQIAIKNWITHRLGRWSGLITYQLKNDVSSTSKINEKEREKTIWIKSKFVIIQ